jgi:hypothetical protein
MGWSTKKTLALLFHDSLKNVGLSAGLVTRHGPKFMVHIVVIVKKVRMSVPNSMKSPREDEQPGPEIGSSMRAGSKS